MDLVVNRIVCDRARCPAPAAREVEMLDQDFYFCLHHALELEALLAVGSEGQPESALVGAGTREP